MMQRALVYLDAEPRNVEDLDQARFVAEICRRSGRWTIVKNTVDPAIPYSGVAAATVQRLISRACES